jgi:mannan endo-1,4-beta-mannosidase
VFTSAVDFVELPAVSVILNAGENTFEILKNWGYFDIDKFSIYGSTANTYNITSSLCDPLIESNAQNLYDFIRAQYGNVIMTGQTSDYYDQIVNTTGKNPLVRGFDMYTYSPMYPWAWDGGHVFGPVDNGETEKVINWYNATGKKGVAEIHWHWPSPSGGQPGTNTFYTSETTFDVSQAVIPGTTEFYEIIRDIDTIAVQLKKIRDAGVPVIWRTLHEAGGGWFWWGAKGSGPCLALYDILRDRLINYHGLHNMIWCWSTPETDWYPGHSKVDMLGFDSYPGEYNYTIQKSMFDVFHDLGEGTKIVAMTENGPIPEIGEAIDYDARWSFFVGWNELVYSQNTTQHIIDMYNHPYAMTIENCPSYQDDTTTSNIAPVASFSFITNDLNVELDGAASTDSDGSITNWQWNLGDGNTASGQNVIHTYSEAGEYSVELTVTDNEGATNSQIKTVSVTNGSSEASSMYVQSAISGNVNSGGGYKYGTATVTIIDNLGSFVSNATVTVSFTGTFNETVSGITDNDGTVTISTTNTIRGGVIVNFCVDNVSHNALSYNADNNLITCTDTKSTTITTEALKVFKSSRDFLIFPNPTMRTVNIDLFNYLESEVNITLFDLKGKIINNVITSGGGIYSFDITEQPKGSYLIRVESDKGQIIKKLLIK